MPKKLNIGRIPYANLFPIFSVLEKTIDLSAYEFINGVPVVVNGLLRDGRIDVSPSSSIEYLRHENVYTLLEGHSISSFGPIGSILLFSGRPIESLDGHTVLTSMQSETSVVLLDIILKKFYECRCTLRPANEPLQMGIRSHSAYLLIGDEALREALRWPKLYVYDLADIWHKNTGLPSVFALWIARRDCCGDNPSLLSEFIKKLDAAKSLAMKDLKAFAKQSPLADILSEDEIVSYWRGISYDFTDEHRSGLQLFRDYARELKHL